MLRIYPEWLSDLIECLQFFYQMTLKLSGQNYVTCSFIIPCLKSLQVAMEALCENDDDNSEFKIQIASALKRSVNFYKSMNLDFLKTRF
jgi:hypothetical protein